MDRRPDRLTMATHPDAAPDADLLGRYAASRSPDAFAALVDRYLPLIYSAALRQTRDPHLAEDAAQATLLVLAQKAGRIDPSLLPGWLVKTAHYAAQNAVRQRNRHAARERRAAAKLKATAAIAAAVLLVGVAAPTAYHYATARPEPAVPAPAAIAPLPAGTDLSRPASGSLPPGMTFEPVAAMGLSDKRWVTPTGRELATVPVDVDELMTRVSVPNATSAFLFRFTPPAADVSWTFSLAEAGSYASITTPDARTGDKYIFVVLAPKANADSLTLTVAAATGPWTTCAVVPATATTPTGGTLAGRPFTFAAPVQEKGQVRLQQTGAAYASGQHTSFYAITAAGRKANHTFMTTDRRGNPIYGFPGQISAYKEFRFDARPYDYHATYRPVPLPR